MGDSLSLMPEKTFCQILQHYQLQGSIARLRTYLGQSIIVVGQLDVNWIGSQFSAYVHTLSDVLEKN